MNDLKQRNDLSLVKIGTQNLDVLDLDIKGNYSQAVEVLTNLIKSKKLGSIVTPETAIAYYLKCKELGLPFMSAIDHIFDVGGKTSIDVHLMRALVLTAGTIHYEEIYNNVPLYQYIDGAGQVIANGTDDSCLPEGYELPKGKTTDELKADVNRITSIGHTAVFKKLEVIPITVGTTPGIKPEISAISKLNYATRYKFTRIVTLKDNKLYTLTEYGEFTMKEAIMARLHCKKDGSVNLDSPWLVYHRNMLEHRAWTFGARKIADDIFFGLLERTEALDMAKIPYTIEEGRAVVIEDESANK